MANPWDFLTTVPQTVNEGLASADPPAATSKSADKKTAAAPAGDPNPNGPPETKTAILGSLKEIGFAIPPGLDVGGPGGLIDQAIQNGGPDPFAYLKATIYSSPQFKHYYKGIFNPDGTMKMNPIQYQDSYMKASTYAAQWGLTVTRDMFGNMASNNVSLDEVKFRVDAAKTMRSNGQEFAAFNDILRANGQPPIKTAQQAMDFMSGQADKKVFDVYQASTFEAGAKSAGVAGVDAKEAMRLAGTVPAFMSLDDVEKGYGNIAKQLREAGVDTTSFGLSTKDLETVEFGGPNRVQLAAKASQALAQSKALTDTQGKDTMQPVTDLKVGSYVRPVVAGAPQEGAGKAP